MSDATDKRVKSGKEIIEDFFRDIKKNDNLDPAIRDRLIELYDNRKFTDKNILNALSEIREGVLKGD